MTAWESAKTRLGRLRPRHVPSPLRAWMVACWVVSLGLVAVLLIPGVTDAVTAQGEGAIATFSAPLTFRFSMLIAIAVLAGTSAVWALLRPRRVVGELVLFAVGLFPVLVLAADAAWIRAGVAALPALVFLLLAHLPLARRGLGTAAALGLVASLPWFSLAAYQSTDAGSRPESWVWVALFGSAAAFAAFGSYYGVARAAESRSRRLTFLYRADLRPGVVLAIVVACVAVTAARLTVARDLFPDPDPQLWSPFARPLASWLIAGVVAALLILIALRASAHPLTRFGERRVVAILAALGNLELIGAMLAILAGIAIAIATGTVVLSTAWMAFVPLAKFVGILILIGVVLLPVFRGTAARWIGLVSAIFLAAITLQGALAVGGADGYDGFAATPVQVLLLLLAAALVLSVLNLLRREHRINAGLVTRFALVPLIAVHAGWLLPAAWSELGRVVVIITVLAALFWLMPPVAEDRTRHGLTVISASLAQLVVLVVFVLAIPSLFADGALTVLGLLWLSIPVIAALLIDTVQFTQPVPRAPMEDA